MLHDFMHILLLWHLRVDTSWMKQRMSLKHLNLKKVSKSLPWSEKKNPYEMIWISTIAIPGLLDTDPIWSLWIRIASLWSIKAEWLIRTLSCPKSLFITQDSRLKTQNILSIISSNFGNPSQEGFFSWEIYYRGVRRYN